MSCTTILAGKNASYDGSTIIARNDDAGGIRFTPKRFTVFQPEEQPEIYRSVLSHAEIRLPGNPMRITAVPDALLQKGIWAACGVNEANVAMTATETITSNERVLGADPMVVYQPAALSRPEKAGGIGEEDLVMLVLPYIRSAREGVVRLGGLLAEYGTYESNGIAFQDVNEIWWLESVGGHHWIARRVPDDAYVVMPNQLGIDSFDLADAYGAKKEYMCSPDLQEFIRENHLAVIEDQFNPRDVFGSHTDADHVYNTPRAWFIERFLNPHTYSWDGPDADFTPESDDIPWCAVPEKRITIEDIKYLLSSHYQGTPFDPYGSYGDPSERGIYRPIGINRNDFLGLIQIRPYMPEAFRTIEWLTFASNAFNALVPFYANINRVPEYLSNTGEDVSTDSFYWMNRCISVLADAHYAQCLPHIERYQMAVQSGGRASVIKYDRLLKEALHGENPDIKAAPASAAALCEEANQEIADMLQKETQSVLNKLVFEGSCKMKNAYSRSDN